MTIGTSLLRSLAVLGLGMALLAVPPSAHGCSCGKNPPVAVALKDASSVFVGTVQSVRPVCVASYGLPLGSGCREWQLYTTDAQIVEFAVSTSFKGDGVATVSLLADSPRSSCYFAFDIGATYLVYAYTRCGDLETSVPEALRATLPNSLVDRVRD